MESTEEKIFELLRDFATKLPHFADGRIDYTNADAAAGLNVIVNFGDEILIVRRSNKVSNYQGKWNVIAGFLDEIKPIRKKAQEELSEELGIDESIIKSMKIFKCQKIIDNEIGKTWYIIPVLVKLKSKPKIELDWEASEYKWIEPESIMKYDTVPGLNLSLSCIKENDG